MKFKWRLSLSTKILGMVSGTLGLSLLSYLYVGTSLISEDKLSYIYDFNLSQVRSATDAISGQIDRASHAARAIGRMPYTSPEGRAAIERTFLEVSEGLNVAGLLLLRPVSPTTFRAELALGPQAERVQAALGQLGWTPKMLQDAPALVGADSDHHLLVAGKTTDLAGHSLAYLLLFSPSAELLSHAMKDASLFLVDAEGKPLPLAAREPAKDTSTTAPSVAQVEETARKIWKLGFATGARDELISGRSYVAAYQRLAFDRLMVLGFIPEEAAFAASRSLVQRSLLLGLGIALIAIGMALTFLRRLTGRLKQMWHATQRVSEGDFSVRVQAASRDEDEVSGLARSFNAMADKIDDLMRQTANQARMEKELETAKLVQRLFFPSGDLREGQVQIAGRFVPASECSGDWWHYARIGDFVVLVVGDVTGHGVSAALVTAGAHAAFSAWKRDALAQSAEPRFDQLIRQLNAAVRAAGGGNTVMTFGAALINLHKLEAELISAGHPMPFLYREPSDGSEPPQADRIGPLMVSQILPLGESELTRVETRHVRLQPGDRLFWYTDGVFESRASDQKKTSKREFMRLLSRFADRHALNASDLCDGLMRHTIRFFGEKADERPDDITMIVATIHPSQALDARKEA